LDACGFGCDACGFGCDDFWADRRKSAWSFLPIAPVGFTHRFVWGLHQSGAQFLPEGHVDAGTSLCPSDAGFARARPIAPVFETHRPVLGLHILSAAHGGHAVSIFFDIQLGLLFIGHKFMSCAILHQTPDRIALAIPCGIVQPRRSPAIQLALCFCVQQVTGHGQVTAFHGVLHRRPSPRIQDIVTCARCEKMLDHVFTTVPCRQVQRRPSVPINDIVARPRREQVSGRVNVRGIVQRRRSQTTHAIVTRARCEKVLEHGSVTMRSGQMQRRPSCAIGNVVTRASCQEVMYHIRVTSSCGHVQRHLSIRAHDIMACARCEEVPGHIRVTALSGIMQRRIPRFVSDIDSRARVQKLPDHGLMTIPRGMMQPCHTLWILVRVRHISN
jgi:hypothetical protein